MELRDFVDEVKKKIDIVEVVNRFIPLDKNNKALCPFHEEKTPSFSVNPRVQYFKCFGCGAVGDVISFLQRHEKINFMEALKELSVLAELQLPDFTLESKNKFHRNRTREVILEETARFYFNSLTPEVKDHLINKRGFDEETIKKFQIGFASGGLRDYLINKKNIAVESAIETGVLKKSEDNNMHDFFYQRIIFPVIKEGRIVSMVGRSLNGKGPKYLNLPGKIKHFYNEEALRERAVFLTESITDCITLTQNGYPAVATLGAYHFNSIKGEQFSECEKVYICPHDDEAGKKSLKQAKKVLGKKLYTVKLPEGIDVNEYFQKYSKDDFDKLVQSAEVKNDNNEKPKHEAVFDNLIDLATYDNQVVFVITDNNKLSIKTEYNKDGEILIPPPKEKIPWLLPRAEEIIKNYETAIEDPEDYYRSLYNDLITYHKDISTLPADEFYDLLVCWDFHTYIPEQLYYSPIICFFAIQERGKSRTGKGMIYVAYRGIHVETVRPAYLFRVADYYNSSIFIDVMDVWGKSGKNDCEDILLNRYERGGDVFRVDPEKSKFMDLENFDTFGPTIIATNKSVHDILGSRSIPISMAETDRIFENDVRREFSLPFRERLEAFRAIQFNRPLPEVKKPCSGRLGDIFKPIIQTVRIINPAKEDAILRLVEIIQKEKLLNNAESTEAEIIRVIVSLENEVSHRILPIEKITQGLNSNRPERFSTSPQKIGRILTSMGFEKAKTSSGNSAIVWNEELITGLKRRYGLETIPVTPVTPVNSSEDTGITGVTDVLQRSLEDI